MLIVIVKVIFFYCYINIIICAICLSKNLDFLEAIIISIQSSSNELVALAV